MSKNDTPQIVEITKSVKESSDVTTLFFNKPEQLSNAKPGQFIMVWLPGENEKPFAVSYQTKTEWAVTIEAKGVCTQKLIGLKQGDKIGIRGPYGKGYTQKKNACVIAGGLGLASIATLIDELNNNKLNPITIIGARNEDRLIFKDRFKPSEEVCFCTDDGCVGEKAFVSEILERMINNGKKFSIVYACGPEIMMNAVLEICNKHKIPCELSLERYMKCGFGVCGHCACGDKLVCMDGPIFSGEEISKMPDFGKHALDKAGMKISLKEYYEYKS
ncbi:dihydroorotate dehydrogenase electron transfer subunit [Nanoarchaeota archaeon]